MRTCKHSANSLRLVIKLTAAATVTVIIIAIVVVDVVVVVVVAIIIKLTAAATATVIITKNHGYFQGSSLLPSSSTSPLSLSYSSSLSLLLLLLTLWSSSSSSSSCYLVILSSSFSSSLLASSWMSSFSLSSRSLLMTYGKNQANYLTGENTDQIYYTHIWLPCSAFNQSWCSSHIIECPTCACLHHGESTVDLLVSTSSSRRPSNTDWLDLRPVQSWCWVIPVWCQWSAYHQHKIRRYLRTSRILY